MGSKKSKAKSAGEMPLTVDILTAIIEKSTRTLEGKINDLEEKYERKIDEVKALNEQVQKKQHEIQKMVLDHSEEVKHFKNEIEQMNQIISRNSAGQSMLQRGDRFFGKLSLEIEVFGSHDDFENFIVLMINEQKQIDVSSMSSIDPKNLDFCFNKHFRHTIANQIQDLQALMPQLTYQESITSIRKHINLEKYEESILAFDIIQIYTDDNRVAYQINKCLREKDFESLKPWLAICLILSTLFNTRWQKQYTTLDSDIKDKKQLTLWRGTNLDIDELVTTYDSYFSIYSFISVTKSKEMAMNFGHECNLKGLNRVLFKIDIDITPETLIQIKDFSKHSHFSAEEEVLIAPGTIFQITSKSYDNPYYIVEVKLVPFSIYIKQKNALQSQIFYGKMVEEQIKKHLSEKREEICMKGNLDDITYRNIGSMILKYEGDIKRLHYSQNRKLYQMQKDQGFEYFILCIQRGNVKSFCWNYCVDAEENDDQLLKMIMECKNIYQLRIALDFSKLEMKCLKNFSYEDLVIKLTGSDPQKYLNEYLDTLKLLHDEKRSVRMTLLLKEEFKFEFQDMPYFKIDYQEWKEHKPTCDTWYTIVIQIGQQNNDYADLLR